MLVVVAATEKAVLTALTGAGGLLAGAKFMLWVNDVIPVRQTVLADLEEANFSGYARGTVAAWSVPVMGDDGLWRVVGDTQTFISTAPFTVPNNVRGWALLNAGGTALIAAERYAEAKNIFEADQAIVEVPKFGAVSKYGS